MARLEQMVSMAGLRMTQSSVRAQIASAIRLVVQLQRLSDGTRRVVSVSEIVGMEGDVIQMQDIYEFVRLATDADGQVRGEFRATGVRPKFLDQLRLVGINISADAFDPTRAL
jgi:pilus assembly protein CpaF